MKIVLCNDRIGYVFFIDQVHKRQNLVVCMVEVLDNVVIDIHLILSNRVPIQIIEIDLEQIRNRNRNIVDRIHVHHQVKMIDDVDVKRTKNRRKAIHVVIDDIHRLVQVIVHQLVVKVVIVNDEIP